MKKLMFQSSCYHLQTSSWFYLVFFIIFSRFFSRFFTFHLSLYYSYLRITVFEHWDMRIRWSFFDYFDEFVIFCDFCDCLCFFATFKVLYVDNLKIFRIVLSSWNWVWAWQLTFNENFLLGGFFRSIVKWGNRSVIFYPVFLLFILDSDYFI